MSCRPFALAERQAAASPADCRGVIADSIPELRPLAMDFASMSQRRAACDRGFLTSHKMAHSALMSFRYFATTFLDSVAVAEGQFLLDVTLSDKLPALPWDQKGGHSLGSPTGAPVEWSWKDYIACLQQGTYERMFGTEGIRRFAVRACPFYSPLCGKDLVKHWEFQVVRTDGVVVCFLPPAQSGRKLFWTFAADEERTAAVADLGAYRSQPPTKLRACYRESASQAAASQAPAPHTVHISDSVGKLIELMKQSSFWLPGASSSAAASQADPEPQLAPATLSKALQHAQAEQDSVPASLSNLEPISISIVPHSAPAPQPASSSSSLGVPGTVASQAAASQAADVAVASRAADQAADDTRGGTRLTPFFLIYSPTKALWCNWQIQLWRDEVYAWWRNSWWRLEGPDPRRGPFNVGRHRWILADPEADE